jgi:hypothetical protein
VSSPIDTPAAPSTAEVAEALQHVHRALLIDELGFDPMRARKSAFRLVSHSV